MTVLEGIRVVELGAWVAGPGAGGLLADWGADVIKVEAPEGDPMRRLFAVLSGHGEPQSPPFDLDNRGKRSVVLDLRSEQGRIDLHDLVATADVFLTNLRPDAVERLGFGPEVLLGAHDRLVYAQVSGFGRTGPDAHRAGYDLGAFFARSGMASQAAPPGQAPVANAGGVGDHITGTTITAGICAALFARERTGRGQLVETSLLRAGIYTMGWPLQIQLRYGKHLPTEPRSSSTNPLINSYEAGDGRWFWLLGLEAARHWPPLVRALGRPELAEDDRFLAPKDRRVHATELIAILDEAFATADRDHWAARFDEHDVWWAPVNTLADVVEDPQALAIGSFVDVPEGAGAVAHRAVMTPIDFSSSPVGPRRGVPGLGEHTDEVLAELGR
ncbi:MAG TPA: CoA transferase [Acidimicrobiales bacterium]